MIAEERTTMPFVHDENEPEQQRGRFIIENGPVTLKENRSVPEAPPKPMNIGGPQLYWKQGKPPTLSERFWQLFEPSWEQRRARATNVFVMANALGVPPSLVEKHYDYFTKEFGMRDTPTTRELLQVMSIFGIGGGLATRPLATIVGLAGFQGLSEAESAAVSLMKNEKYRVFQNRGLSDLLPEETSTLTKDIVDTLDMIGKGLLVGGVIRRAPLVAEQLAKDIITQYRLPRRLYINPADLRTELQTGSVLSAAGMDIVKGVGLTGQQYRAALKDGLHIEIPAEKITTIQDKPWFARVKKLFKLDPAQSVTVQHAGRLQQKPPIAGFLEWSKEAVAQRLKDHAAPFVEKELTPEAWQEEFGPNLTVETPIGLYKLGEHQYEKLAAQGREKYFGLIKPTLKEPLAIVRDERQGAVFIKTFRENGTLYFVSVGYDIDGLKVIVTNHPKREGDVVKLLRKGELLYMMSTALDASAPASPKQSTVAGGLPDISSIPPVAPQQQTKTGKAGDEVAAESTTPNIDQTVRTGVPDFVPALDGAIDFGHVPTEIEQKSGGRFKGAPIRLEKGISREYGHSHISPKRVQEFKDYGYQDELHALEDITKNISVRQIS